ncbi:sensor histidine kinase [candidate division KSB1 bacterium]
MSRAAFEKIIKSFFRHRIVYHLVFWSVIALYIFLTIKAEFGTVSISFLLTGLLILFQVIISYSNFFFIERFLYKKKYTLYLISLFTVVAVYSSIFHYLFKTYFNYTSSIFQTIVSVLFLIFFTSAIKVIKKGIAQYLEFQDLKEKRLRAENDLLKAQVNPHFLFNTLNSLYGLCLKDSKKAPDAILELSEIMRYMVEAGKKETVSVHSEIKFIKNYISLENLRLVNKPDITIDIEGDTLNTRVPPMILIPFIENCFKHGIDSTSAGAFINIMLNINKTDLRFAVRNSKSKNNKNSRYESPGTGIANTTRRLELIYPDRHMLKITDNTDDFYIDLSIKL